MNKAIERLINGNRAFVEGNSAKIHYSTEQLQTLAKGQFPFAVVLTCSDSRVSPEIIFNQGLGDLFVVRVAGNILNDDIVASIEYAVEHLGTSLVVVLGHQDCGAVRACISHVHDTPKIEHLLAHIAPALEKAQKDGTFSENDVIVKNIMLTVEKLKHTSPVLSKKYTKGTLNIIGAYFEVSTGKCFLFDKKQ